jgi:hydrogenase maturation protein HypF
VAYHRFFIRGLVQGVGFRPYIYRKAKKLGLTGFVRNMGEGVEVVVDEPRFGDYLTDLPPLARIDSINSKVLRCRHKDFRIMDSEKSRGETIIAPDIFACDDCIRELRTSSDRRHNYYFITCTNCGPRYSMISDYPYDRANTSMDDYQMCRRCSREYLDPMDRRYHAQTIACKRCGPRLKLTVDGEDVTCADDFGAVRAAADVLKSGKPVSVKGVGGYHILSRGVDEAVDRVRAAIGRGDKPFAMMIRDVEMASEFVYISDAERVLLESPQRPIVVLKKKISCFRRVSELDSLGLMLAYTPLHYLFFDFISEPLVMTSLNRPGEPVMVEGDIGGWVLSHGRRIVNRCDDSVLKVVGSQTLYLRRSRGYVPLPVRLAIDCVDTLSLGAQLNNCVAAAKGKNCFLSQHIGDASNAKTFDFMKDALDSLIRLTRLNPELIACDMHPGYASTSYAKSLGEKIGVCVFPIQHHKAHVASAAAEHGLSDYVGIAVDGLGYGEDGTLWGGEVFRVSDGVFFERVGSLMPVPQLGGDSSALNPKKMLFSVLSTFMDDEDLVGMGLFEESESRLYLRQISEGFNTPATTSAGRILDAASALLGLCERRTYDGRPSLLLESVAEKPLKIEPKYMRADGRRVLDTGYLFRFLMEHSEDDRGSLAATAQAYLAGGLFEIAKEQGLPIVLSGGVSYNKMITKYMLERGTMINREIPAGDGGICVGQAYLANLMANKGINP